MAAVKRLDAIDFVNVGAIALESFSLAARRRPASCWAASSIEIGETYPEIIGKGKTDVRARSLEMEICMYLRVPRYILTNRLI